MLIIIGRDYVFVFMYEIILFFGEFRIYEKDVEVLIIL